MNILALHFGHDASVTVLKNGEPAAYVLAERHRRIKHAVTLRMTEVDAALAEAGLDISAIDYCAVSSTQCIELVIDDGRRFSVELHPHPRHEGRNTFADALQKYHVDPSTTAGGDLRRFLYDPKCEGSYLCRKYRHLFPEYAERQPQELVAFGWMDRYLWNPAWGEQTLDEIAGNDLRALLEFDDWRLGMHFPVTVRIDGATVPGYYVSHHSAHAASTFYQSGFDHAAILTHDGFTNGVGGLSGMFYYGNGSRIYPVSPHCLDIGATYDQAGMALNLGEVGPAGKLMGLAGYGKPRFFSRSYVGNWYDWLRQKLPPWIHHCINQARQMGYDMSALGDRNRMTEPINVDIAASTQKLCEEVCLAAVETMFKLFTRIGLNCPSLCLSGGTALNCPSNARIHREGPFRNVFVEPGCDDSGISLGAALFVHHNLLGQPRRPRGEGCASPYVGASITAGQIESVLKSANGSIVYQPSADSASAAADDLVADRVIGWFEGRSEIGPRALGHRSILADARHAHNWRRVNLIKGREPWRPFAPAVLASDAKNWFIGAPLPSPYMLFTSGVTSNQLPAITHADGSARIQTVDADCGEFHRVLESFKEKTGVPVVLNTSFNGPGEPIVETPEDALRFLLKSELDALYIGGFRVTRAGDETRSSAG